MLAVAADIAANGASVNFLTLGLIYDSAAHKEEEGIGFKF